MDEYCPLNDIKGEQMDLKIQVYNLKFKKLKKKKKKKNYQAIFPSQNI